MSNYSESIPRIVISVAVDSKGRRFNTSGLNEKFRSKRMSEVGEGTARDILSVYDNLLGSSWGQNNLSESSRHKEYTRHVNNRQKIESLSCKSIDFKNL